MPDREESYTPRTLEQFAGRGLSPCDGCLQTALRRNDSPLSSRRVYGSRFADAKPVGARACPYCGFIIFPDGAIGASPDTVREVCRREAEEDRGRDDVEANAGSQVPTKGGLQGMRHGDTKTEFETGAKRDTDEGKGRPSLISPVLIHRLSVLLAKGAKHYGDDNWTKGMPYRRTMDSVIRHAFQWLAGDGEEDHLAAIAFGVMCLMTYEEEAVPEAEGRNPLDDRCRKLQGILLSILTSPKKDPKIGTMDQKELEARRGTG